MSETTERLSHADFDRLLLDCATLQRQIKAKEEIVFRALIHPETGPRFRKRVLDAGVPGLQDVARAANMIAPMIDSTASEADRRKAADDLIKMIEARSQKAAR